MTDPLALQDTIRERGARLGVLRSKLQEVVVGQSELLDSLLIALLADGHVLLEGLPGLAKSLTVQTLGEALGADFKRIQFTPDLLPADVVGGPVFDRNTGSWTLRRGPVFANLVLADEVNRAPAKVQAALLEAMQERQVSIGGETHTLPKPFLVLATQNPVEQEGTYPLPEAQVDRFLMKVVVGYPTRDEELQIVRRMAKGALPPVDPVVTLQEIEEDRKLVDQIYCDEKVEHYVVDLVFATREPGSVGLKALEEQILYGASPRASIALLRTAKARAFLDGRGHVIPQDVKATARAVLRHRVIPSFEAEAEDVSSEQLVEQLLEHVPVP